MLNTALLVFTVVTCATIIYIFRELALGIMNKYKNKPTWFKLLVLLVLSVAEIASLLGIMVLFL